MPFTEPPTTVAFTTAAGDLVAEVSGDGPPLLLLPAAAHTRHDFAAIRPTLDEHFRTYALDWPAHGDSPAPRPGWAASAPAFAALVREVLDQIPDGPVLVMGSSVGGFSAARVALDAPELVAGVVLVDSGGFVRRSPLARAFCWTLSHPRLLSRIYPAFCRRYLRTQTALDEEIRAAASASMRDDPAQIAVVAALWGSFGSPAHDLRAEAPAIAVPALVVWGRRDPVIPVSSGRRGARLLGTEIVELDTGHVPFSSRPGEFLDAVLPFLVEPRSLAADDRSHVA